MNAVARAVKHATALQKAEQEDAVADEYAPAPGALSDGAGTAANWSQPRVEEKQWVEPGLTDFGGKEDAEDEELSSTEPWRACLNFGLNAEMDIIMGDNAW